jgi:hypothetical protein
MITKDFIIGKDFYTYSIKILRQEKFFVIIAAVDDRGASLSAQEPAGHRQHPERASPPGGSWPFRPS